MTKEINYHQKKSQLLKEINFLFQSPSLNQQTRQQVIALLQEVSEILRVEAYKATTLPKEEN